MPAIRSSSALIIRCFKSVESFADWLTGAAGFWFVCICWGLTAVGGITFFDVLLIHQQPTIPRLAFIPLAALIASNLYASYYHVTTIDPGNPLTVLSDVRVHAPWMISARAGEGEARGRWNRIKACGKCGGPKPVYARDASWQWTIIVPKGINQCVGLHNLRYFLLFMTWLSLACWSVVLVGYDMLWTSMKYRAEWSAWTPPIVYTLIYILSAAIGLAVPILLGWHLFLVARGETSIEAHDNEYFMKRAREQGLRYVNPYDCGWKTNLQLCFNVGPGRLPYWTLLVPARYPSTSPGWRYPLNEAAIRGDVPGVVVGDDGDELTDDEGGGGGWWTEDVGVVYS